MIRPDYLGWYAHYCSTGMPANRRMTQDSICRDQREAMNMIGWWAPPSATKGPTYQVRAGKLQRSSSFRASLLPSLRFQHVRKKGRKGESRSPVGGQASDWLRPEISALFFSLQIFYKGHVLAAVLRMYRPLLLCRMLSFRLT